MTKRDTFDEVGREMNVILTAAGLKGEDLLATLPEARERIYARRYGKKPADSSRVRPDK